MSQTLLLFQIALGVVQQFLKGFSVTFLTAIIELGDSKDALGGRGGGINSVASGQPIIFRMKYNKMWK